MFRSLHDLDKGERGQGPKIKDFNHHQHKGETPCRDGPQDCLLAPLSGTLKREKGSEKKQTVQRRCLHTRHEADGCGLPKRRGNQEMVKGDVICHPSV